jgi:hypothetical protein
MANVAVLSATAQSAFVCADYPRAATVLADLAVAAPADARVAYNAAVVHFYHESRARDPVPLLATTLALDSEPHDVSATPVVPRILAVLASQPVMARIKTTAGLVPLFNAAVIAYQRGSVRVAEILAQFLFANVEAMEDWLAFRTCCLVIDINLRTGKTATVATIITYVERLVPALSTSSPQQIQPDSADNPSSSGDCTAPLAASLAASDDESENADLLAGLSSTRFASVAPPWLGSAISIITPPSSFTDLKFCMHLYAARLGAAREDPKALKNEARSAVAYSEDDGRCPTSAALLVQAKLEVSSWKGLRVMEVIRDHAPSRVFRVIHPLLLNNLGIIHHSLGRHAIAAVYLDQARSAFTALYETDSQQKPELASPGTSLSTARPRHPLSITGQAQSTHVAYNLGLQHLQLDNYRTALSMFGECARADEVLASSSPILWIRMAECCVGEANANANAKPVAVVRGQGRGRRYVLNTREKPETNLMQYAAVCARAALAIIDGTVASSAASNASNSSGSLPSAPTAAAVAPTMSTPVKARLRCSALALIAYTTLNFDPAAAIVACDELVSCSRPGDSDHAVLGRLYGAEALCMLGRPGEASDRLAPLLAMSGSSVADGREGAFVNAALAHALRGDMAAAARAAKAALKVTELSNSTGGTRRNAVMVAAYVSLRDGNADAARQILRQVR